MVFAEFSARGLPVLSKGSLKKLRRSKGSTFLLGQTLLMISAHPQLAAAAEVVKPEPVYEVGELFELSIQLSYLLLLLGLLGVGTFYVIRQVLVRRELDLSAKELQVLNTLLVPIFYMLEILGLAAVQTEENSLSENDEKKWICF